MSSTIDTYPAPLRVQATLAGRVYDEIVDEHGRVFDWPRSAPHLCKCGRDFTRGQALGQHLAAIRRQADQAMAGEQDRVNMLLRIPGSWLAVETEVGNMREVWHIESAMYNDIVFSDSRHTLREALALGWRVTEAGGRA